MAIKASNKFGSITYSGLTGLMVGKFKPKDELSNMAKFKLYQRDNAITDNCMLIDSISNTEKRRLISLWSISGKVRVFGQPSGVMVSLSKMGMVIIYNGFYQLTNRGNYYARAFSMQRAKF